MTKTGVRGDKNALRNRVLRTGRDGTVAERHNVARCVYARVDETHSAGSTELVR
jgi:hypothetical protein